MSKDFTRNNAVPESLVYTDNRTMLRLIQLFGVVAALAVVCWPTRVATSASTLNFQAARDYSAQLGGHAALVAVDGEVVFERYDNGFTADRPQDLRSGTKSFWGPAVAAMIEDGLVTSLDEPVSQTLVEWRADPRKRRITIRHLLDLTAGLAQDVRSLQGNRATLARDLFTHAVGLRAVAEPGVRFVYGPSYFYALGELMKRKLASRKQTPLDYLKRRILDPIGVTVAEWVHDRAGNPHMPNGASLTAREWLKFGGFLLDGGRKQGRQIVRAELLRVEGSAVNVGYGFSFWRNEPGGYSSSGRAASSDPHGKGGWIYPAGLPDLYMAAGAGGNRLYVIPSQRVLIIRLGDSDRFSDARFLGLLFQH
jgi:CubicO group peptidase (beta-lactamase class C family)